MPYILYQVIKSLRENSALLVAANSSCFRSAEINCSLPFLNRPRRKRPARHWCEARKRPRSFVTDLDTQTSPSQPAHKLIFFPTFFFWAKRFKVSLFFSRFSRNNHAHTTPLHAAIVPHKYFAHCTNTRAKRTTVTYEHKRR